MLDKVLGALGGEGEGQAVVSFGVVGVMGTAEDVEVLVGCCFVCFGFGLADSRWRVGVVLSQRGARQLVQ